MREPAASDKVLAFAAGGRELAIAASEVAEVVVFPRVTRVPQAPAALYGLANLRGQAAPIVSLDALLGGDAHDAPSRVIVLAGENPVGLAVDAMRGMRDLDGAILGEDATDAGESALRLLRPGALLAEAFPKHAARARAGRAAAAPASAPLARAAELQFLQFELAGQAYALPLEQVREVADLPAEARSLPTIDAVMLGVAPFRDALLPLISLRALLGLGVETASPSGRIIVASLGGAALGLVVDRVTAILRVDEASAAPTPSVLNRGEGEGRIDSLVRTPGGLVAVVSVERIFRDETIARMLAEADQAGAAEQTAEESVMEQFLLFRLGDETYGLPLASVKEVVRAPNAVTPVPNAPDYVAGVMSHRGVPTPLIDQRRRFEVAGDRAAQGRVIVVAVEGLYAGFIVDAVDRILGLPAEALEAAPALAAADEPVFDRVARVEVGGDLVLVVDPRQLLTQAERDIMRDVASAAPA